ncbi:MAG TPA: ABC transporter ATP-binding protein [Candidatus Bathyarchaeia archaeon]|nr:ABC transporter ATP-binding protein [Candidatus Bathyarchaeia archaeon]
MITIKGLSKGLGNFHLGPLNLEVNDAQILVVLGRNGSGKTTLLNLIAGILQTDEGEIFLDKNLLNGISLEKRKIGYVFQRLYLFPHLDVFSNITFGLQSRKNSELVIKTKEMISILGIEQLLSRKIQSLSGGEQQKVAIARTLLTKPRLLLMDEPFSNIDVTIKYALIQEIKTIVHDLKIPTIYVTHYANEAFNMADKIMILHNGYVVEDGTKDEIMLKPKAEITKSLIRSLQF